MANSRLKLKTVPAVTVVTNGTAVPISLTSILVYSVSIESLSTNTGVQYVGDDTVTTANGMKMSPGEGVELDVPRASRTDQFDLKDVYVNSSSDGAEFRVLAWIRE